jgi:hypothetical protein
MRPELLALIVPVALALQYARRRRTPVRSDAAEVLRWWGLGRGLADPSRPREPLREAAPDAGFDPLDVVLGLQAGERSGEVLNTGASLSAAVPSHAITLQGSALFRTGDRQRVHAAVEGELEPGLRGTVMLVTCERRDNDSKDWIWLCDLTVAAMEGVRPRGPGLLLRRRPSGGGAKVELPGGYVKLTLESAELDALYDVRIASGCDEVAAREALTPAMIAWLCERGPEALVVETGGASVRMATAGMLSSDEELDAFTKDACWLAHAFIEDTPREAQAA